MRKVTFPIELDATEYCTEDLRKKLVPVRDQIRELRKEEQEVERAAKRIKKTKSEESKKKDTKTDGEDTAMAEAEAEVDSRIASQQEEQQASIAKAKAHLKELLDPELLADAGCNATGLYELRALITHQGASADSGHYTAYVKKDPSIDPTTGKPEAADTNWWWFNDDKVSMVDEEKILTLSGGGKLTLAQVITNKIRREPFRFDMSLPCHTTSGIRDRESVNEFIVHFIESRKLAYYHSGN